jgi:hypothetical protein
VSPGFEITIPVELKPNGDEISAFQFDLLYDTSALHIRAVTQASLARAHKKIYTAAVEEGRLRVVVAGPNDRVLPQSVTIITIVVSASPQATPGLHEIRFRDVSASDAYGTSAGVVALDGAVSVAPSEDAICFDCKLVDSVEEEILNFGAASSLVPAALR